MFVSVSDCCLILWIFTLYPKGDWFCRRPSREWWSVTQIESVRFEGDQRSHQLCSCEGFHFEGVQSRPEVKRRVWIGTMSPRVETGNDHSRIVQSRWFQVDHASSSCEKPGMSPDSSTFISCAKARTGAHYQHKTEGWDLGLRLVAWTNCWSSKENCSYILLLWESPMTIFKGCQCYIISRDEVRWVVDRTVGGWSGISEPSQQWSGVFHNSLNSSSKDLSERVFYVELV